MNISAQYTEKTDVSNKNAISATGVSETDIQFQTTDRYTLSGTLFRSEIDPGYAGGPLVLISSATGAPRGFYHAFARELVLRGSRAVLTYDYRGLPASPPPPGFNKRINMRDWAHFDMPAAMLRLDEEAPGHANGRGRSVLWRPGPRNMWHA